MNKELLAKLKIKRKRAEGGSKDGYSGRNTDSLSIQA